MDAASILRAYNTALHEARTEHGVLRASRGFRAKHDVTDDQWSLGMLEIRHAHLDRAGGRGSPAACDEALAKAIRENGNV